MGGQGARPAGVGRNSNVVCGLEWVLEHGRIDVVNTSLAEPGNDYDSRLGDCIRSTWNGGGYREPSRTSMAAPHVAGAVALYRADRPSASVPEVRSWLHGTASVAQGSPFGFAGDPALYLGPGDANAAGA